MSELKVKVGRKKEEKKQREFVFGTKSFPSSNLFQLLLFVSMPGFHTLRIILNTFYTKLYTHAVIMLTETICQVKYTSPKWGVKAIRVQNAVRCFVLWSRGQQEIMPELTLKHVHLHAVYDFLANDLLAIKRWFRFLQHV